MITKNFKCKMEEVPVVAGFVSVSLQEDLADFQDYSSDYAQTTVDAINTKRNYCLDLEKADSVAQQLKAITARLVDKELSLRPLLNKLEGYVKRAADNLDVASSDFGVKTVRDAVSKGNDEGIIAGMKALLGNVARNQAALETSGMKTEFVAELTATLAEIDSLNNEQNRLQNERAKATATNLKDYNDLWDLVTTVCQDARAIYKGVDEVKLKRYTMSSLLQRVNAEGTRAKTDVSGTTT